MDKFNQSLKYSFGDIAEEYDAIRPGYPTELYNTLVLHCQLNSTTKALEIGCGTGQATIDLIKHIGKLLCIDLGEEQIRIAKTAFKNHKNITFKAVAFENFEISKQQFDLIFCAQAFHWLDPEKRFLQTSKLLKNKGYLALIWNIDSSVSTSLQEKIDILYQKIVPSEPSFSERQAIFTKDVEQTKVQMTECGYFANVVSYIYENPHTYDSDSYIRLISTYAYIRAIDSTVRDRLFDAISKTVDSAGGEITVFHNTHFVVGLKRPMRPIRGI